MSATVTQTRTAPLTPRHDSSYVPRGNVTATVNFFEGPPDGSQPFNFVEKQPEGQAQHNLVDNYQQIKVHDIRGSESAFNLDKDAFQVVSGVSSAISKEDWYNDDTIKRVYYPEVVKLILDSFPGTHRVTVFDHTIRRAGKNENRQPVDRVHVDQTARSTEWRVKLHDPEEADTLLNGRFRIINVWRSIDGPVQSHPLAYASADTVDPKDIRPIEHRYPHRTGETAGVQYNPDQKFYYWSGMDNEERVFLKCYDSREGVGKSVPHTSFVDHRTPKGAKARASIEVRTIVYG